MATDVSIRVGVDGEKEFRSALNGINSQIKNLNSEMRTIVTSMNGMDNAEEKVSQQTDVLGRTMDATRQKISTISAEYDRQKTKLQQLGNTLDQLQNAQDKDEAAITKATNAYNRQQTVVNKLGAQLNNATSDMNRMEQEMRDLESGARDTGNALDDAGDKASGFGDKVRSGFTVLKGVAANVIADGIQAIASNLTSLGGEAINAADSLTKFQSTMSFAGFSTSEIEATTAAMQEYASQTVYDLETVSNTVAQLGANGVADYEQLTEAAGNLNAVAGGNAETFKSVAMMLTQTAGAGKLTTENWNQLADAIPGASGLLQEAMREAGAYTGNFRDAMEDGEISAQEFMDAIMELGSSDVAQQAATSVSTIEGAVGNLKATVVDAVTGMLTDGGGLNAVTGAINGITESISSLISAFQEGGIAGLFSQIGTMFTALVENFTTYMPTLLQTGGQIITTIATGIMQGIPLLASYAQQMMAALNQYLSENFPVLVQEGLQALVSFTSGLQQNIGMLVDSALQIVQTLASGIIQNIPTIIETVPQIVTNIANVINDNAPKLIATAASLIGQLAIGLVKAIPTLVASIPQIIEAIVSVFMAFNWLDLGKTIITALKNGITAMVGAVQSAAGNVLNAINNTLKNLPSTLLNLGRQGIQGLINGIKSLLGAVGSAIQTIANAILNGVKSLPGQLLNIGSQIVQGLINGIKSGISGVVSAIGSMVSSAISTAKNALGIHSPSRVFRDQIGLMITRGMALGISRGERQVLNAADRLNDKLIEKEKELNNQLTAMEQEERDRQYAEELADYQNKLKALYAELEKTELEERQGILDEIAKLEADWNEKQLEAQRSAEKEKLEAQIDTLKDFQKEYEDALSGIEKSQESMTDKLKSYGDLFTTVKKETGDFLELSDLEDDIAAIESYGDALEALKGRGISDSLMNEIISMDIDDATAYAEKLLAMTDDQYNEYMALWEQKQKTAQDVAKQFYASEFDALESEFISKIPSELDGVKSEFEDVGVQSVQGLIAGMLSQTGALFSAARSLISDTLGQMQDEAGIHSPSRVAADMVGAPLAEGVEMGFLDKIDSAARNIASVMQSRNGIISRMETPAYAGAAGGVMTAAPIQVTVPVDLSIDSAVIARKTYTAYVREGTLRGQSAVRSSRNGG